MPLNRRNFLKLSAATAAAGAAAFPVYDSVMAMNRKPEEITFSEVPTFCDLCFWNCGKIARVVNEKVVGFAGNPLSLRSRGRLCGRGNGGLGLLYDPDRLQHPMLNVGKRGDPKWRKVSWDEALSFIADKMTKIKKTHGPEAVSLISHGPGGSFWRHMLRAYGSPNLAAPSFAQCRGPRDVGFVFTFGADIGSPENYDFKHSRFIVLFGSHFGENSHNSMTQDIMNGLAKGAKLAVIDPRHSNIASKANWWLPIKPATDLALILAWIKIIIDENLYDHDYIEKYAMGLDELKEAVKDYTVEWAAKETDIAADTIISVAREMAKQKPAVCIGAGRFAVWYGDDSQRSRAIAILNALMGSWGRKGGYYFRPKGRVARFPGLPPYPEMEDALTGDFVGGFPPNTTVIRQTTITGEPYPVKGWIVYGSNLIKCMPDTKKTIQALRALDLVVVVEVLPVEMTAWADVVLPENTYLERYDDLNITRMEMFQVSLRQPAMKPVFAETKPSSWITKELGNKLGLSHYFPWADVEEYLQGRCDAAGLDFAELKQKGVISFPDRPKTYITPDNQPEFNTFSGKIELYSEDLADADQDPVPRYTKHEEPPPGYFRLNFGRTPLHSFSRTINNFILADLVPENELWINAKKARELGLENGQYVRLENQDGVKAPNNIKIKITQRIREDNVYMYHGFGMTSKYLNQSYRRGIGTDALITSYKVDPLMGGTAMRGTFVKIIKEV